MQLSSDSVTRNFGCNYLRGAVSSDQCYLAALVDEGYLGIFSFHELCFSAAFRSGEPVESLNMIISGTKSHCIGAAPIFKIPIHASTRSGIKSSSGRSRISSPDSLRDMCWSPSHVSGGRLLALAGLNCMSIWEVPKGRAKGPRLQNGCFKHEDADETMVLKPTLLYSCDIVFPGIMTPLNSTYSRNASVDTASSLRTIDSANSTGDSKSQFGSQTPSIKSIEWHMSAVPTLIAFSTTCDPIRIVLPRSDAELEITRVLCSSSDSLTEVEGSEVVDRPPSSRSATQTGPKNAAPRVHPFGGASLKSDIVIAVDSIGSLTVLAGPVNDGPKTLESSSSLMSVKNKQVRAVCLSGDDSIVCIAYSLSWKSSGTASVQTPSKDLLSIESLQEAISASHHGHGSRSRSSTGFQHALAGTSLRDAIYVPDRAPSGLIPMSVEASSHTPVCISAAASRAHSPPSHQDACAAISQSEDPEAESTSTVCVLSDSTFVSVMDSLLCIGDDRQHCAGVIEQSADGRVVMARSVSSFLDPSTPEVLRTESNAKHLPLNTVSCSTISRSGGGYSVLPVPEPVGEVEVKWLREPNAVFCSTNGDTRRGDSTHRSDEKNQNEKAKRTAETVMRVPITDPLLAQPDLLFYREHTQLLPLECSSSPEPAVTAVAVANRSSLLMGYLAVGSTQSSRVLVYALKGSLSGYSATVHHTFNLPKDQRSRGIYLSSTGELLCVFSALKSACAPSLASCSTTSHCATYFTASSFAIPLAVPYTDIPLPTAQFKSQSSNPIHAPPVHVTAEDRQGCSTPSAATISKESSIGPSVPGLGSRGTCTQENSNNADFSSLLSRVLEMQIALSDRLGGIEQSLSEQRDSMTALHSKLDTLLTESKRAKDSV